MNVGVNQKKSRPQTKFNNYLDKLEFDKKNLKKHNCFLNLKVKITILNKTILCFLLLVFSISANLLSGINSHTSAISSLVKADKTIKWHNIRVVTSFIQVLFLKFIIGKS